MDGLTLRLYQGGDLPFLRVLDIQGYESPWGEATIQQYSRGIIAAVLHDRPEGYACIEIQKTQVRLLRLTVARNFRRIGIGSLLMRSVFSEISAFKKITTLVPESALPAQCFLRYHGWKCVNPNVENAFEICGRRENGFYFVKTL